MNRTDISKQTIYSWIDKDIINDVVIVDWNSQSPLIEEAYIQELISTYPNKLKIVHVVDVKYFSMAKAYNLAINNTKLQHVIKADVDYKLVGTEYLSNLDKSVLDTQFLTGDYKIAKSTTGFLILNKKYFERGYNELINSYGGDDWEFYKYLTERYKLSRFILKNINDIIYHIPHDDVRRVEYFEVKEKNTIANLNSLPTFNPQQYKVLSDSKNYSKLTAI